MGPQYTLQCDIFRLNNCLATCLSSDFSRVPCSLALGVAFGWLVLAPLLSLILEVLGCHILLRMHEELALSHGTIRRLCANGAYTLLPNVMIAYIMPI